MLELRRRDARLGVIPVANPITLIELLSRLGSTDDEWEEVLEAVRLLWTHTAVQKAHSRAYIQSLADPETSACMYLFGRCVSADERFVWMLEDLAQRIAWLPGIWIRREENPFPLKLIEFVVKRTEEQFAAVMLRSWLQPIDPTLLRWPSYEPSSKVRLGLRRSRDDPNFFLKLAIDRLRYLGNKVGVAVVPETSRSLVGRVIGTHETMFWLTRLILDKIGSGARLSNPSRRNWIWDLQLSFYAGESRLPGGEDVVLVTDDGDIAFAANNAGQRNRVVTSSEYLAATPIRQVAKNAALD